MSDPSPRNTIDTGEVFDCVVVGGGLSGLAAALFLKQEGRPNLQCLVLENHPIFGGEAKRNEFIVDGQRPDCSAGIQQFYHLPPPETFMAEVLRFDRLGLA